jgi:hypothetical protein
MIVSVWSNFRKLCTALWWVYIDEWYYEQKLSQPTLGSYTADVTRLEMLLCQSAIPGLNP